MVNKWLPSVGDAAVRGRSNRNLVSATLCRARVSPHGWGPHLLPALPSR
jgi:hypothetical protein